MASLILVSVPAGASGEPPFATDDGYVVRSGKQLNVPAPGVLANDTDPESDALTAILVNPPTRGKLILRADGSFRYTPTAAAGGDSFTYRASDGTGTSNFGRVHLRIDAVPVAVDDSRSFIAPGPLTVAAPGVLLNDFDPAGDLIEARLVKKPSRGQVQLAPDGGFTYTPSRNFKSADWFTYRAVDDRNKSNIARVDIRLKTTNTAPTGTNDSYIVFEGGVVSVPPPGVLANDSDADGDSLVAEVLSGPSPADDFQFSPDGSFFIQPIENWDSDLTFTYRVSDGIAFSPPIEVYIDIKAVNNPPVGEDDFYEMQTGETSLHVDAPGVLANDFDPVEFDTPHVYELVTPPAFGELDLNTDGSFTYTPDPGYTGFDGFSYRPGDGGGPGNLTNVGFLIN